MSVFARKDYRQPALALSIGSACKVSSSGSNKVVGITKSYADELAVTRKYRRYSLQYIDWTDYYFIIGKMQAVLTSIDDVRLKVRATYVRRKVFIYARKRNVVTLFRLNETIRYCASVASNVLISRKWNKRYERFVLHLLSLLITYNVI